MDFISLVGLGLYGNIVNNYKSEDKNNNSINNISRYYDNTYSCNQINKNRNKVFSKASENFVDSLSPKSNIINNIWRIQDNRTSIDNRTGIDNKIDIDNKEHFNLFDGNLFNGNIFDKYKYYSSLFLIVIIGICCLCSCL
jgi:hypothetical protein